MRRDLIQADARFVKGLVHDGQDELDMPPGGDFRYHAPVYLVQFGRRGDDAGEDRPPVFHHGGRSLVAAGLDAKTKAQRSISFHMMMASSSLSR